MGVFIKYRRLIANTKCYISFVIWWGLCSHDEGSLSRRTGPDPSSFEETCLQRGEARSFGTTALSNYEGQVVARVEGGVFGVSMQAMARGLRRIVESERLHGERYRCRKLRIRGMWLDVFTYHRSMQRGVLYMHWV